jgi:ABC-type multidrug transport system ATPase subunit
MLKRLKEQGITILVSTPYMDEAGLCDRVALMQEGKLLSVGTPQEITGAFKHTIRAVKSENMFQLLKDIKAFPGAQDCYSFGEYHHVIMKEDYDKEKLKQYLEQKGHKQVEVKETEPNIEDCFMQLMKN